MLFEMCAGYELPSFKPNSTHLSDVEIYPQVQILSSRSLFASALFLFHLFARFVTNYITHYCSIYLHRFVKNTNSYVNNINNDKYGRYFISLSMTYVYTYTSDLTISMHHDLSSILNYLTLVPRRFRQIS